jgi:hypothetical protein
MASISYLWRHQYLIENKHQRNINGGMQLAGVMAYAASGVSAA